MFTANEREIMGLYGKYEVKIKIKYFVKIVLIFNNSIIDQKIIVIVIGEIYIYFNSTLPVYIYL